MGLKIVVDDLESVDEGVRGLYVERDGKFRLDVEGIEDTSGLKSALEKEREAFRKAEKSRKELEQRYAGIDPDKVRTLLSRFENDEEAKLIADGKFDAVFERRTEKLRGEFTRQLDEVSNKEKAALERVKAFEQKVLDNSIRAAAAKVGIHVHAIDDALFRARGMFSLDANGDPVQLDEDGRPLPGKDGKSPFSPVEWLESMKEKAPHWFPASATGGGGSGDKGGQGSAKTMKRAAFDALPAHEKGSFVRGGGKITD